MKKTTLYLEDDIVQKLKEETLRRPGASMTSIINNALRWYIDSGPVSESREALLKGFGRSSAYKKVKDAVAYQKMLRSDWDS